MKQGSCGLSSVCGSPPTPPRDYQTASGNRPVKDFLNRLPVAHRAQIAAAMRDVRDFGLPAARHLLGEIFEVRADAGEVIYRILFATEGLGSQILLSLEAFTRKTRRTPPGKIDLAERRLADWRRRGRSDQK